jgi:hypothetical protein
MKECTKMVKKTEKEFINGKTDQFMKGNGLKII